MSAIDLRTSVTSSTAKQQSGANFREPVTSHSDYQRLASVARSHSFVHLQHLQQHNGIASHLGQPHSSGRLIESQRLFLEQQQQQRHDNELRLWQLEAGSARGLHELGCGAHQAAPDQAELQALMLARLRQQQHSQQQEVLLAKQLASQSLSHQQSLGAFERQQHQLALKSQQEQLSIIQRLNLLHQQQQQQQQQLDLAGQHHHHRHLSASDSSSQRMIIDGDEFELSRRQVVDDDDDDDENDNDNHDNDNDNDEDVIMMQQDLPGAKSDSVREPQNLKKSFIKRYRKFRVLLPLVHLVLPSTFCSTLLFSPHICPQEAPILDLPCPPLTRFHSNQNNPETQSMPTPRPHRRPINKFRPDPLKRPQGKPAARVPLLEAQTVRAPRRPAASIWSSMATTRAGGWRRLAPKRRRPRSGSARRARRACV